MRRILLATKNKGKVKEILYILGDLPINFSTIPEDDKSKFEETGSTYYENALGKAQFYGNKYKIPALADDSGLEIDALNGAPGILSARFLGENTPFEKKIEEILRLLENKKNRKARFKTVAVLYFPESGKVYKAEGTIEGEILKKPIKKEGSGFGYDPIFKPNGFDTSFSMLGEDIKNKISHRANALKKMRKILEELTEVDNDRD